MVAPVRAAPAPSGPCLRLATRIAADELGPADEPPRPAELSLDPAHETRCPAAPSSGPQRPRARPLGPSRSQEKKKLDLADKTHEPHC